MENLRDTCFLILNPILECTLGLCLMPIPLINNQILEDESLWFLLDPIVEFVSSHSDLLSSSPYRNIVMILHPEKVDLRIDFNVLHYHHTRG